MKCLQCEVYTELGVPYLHYQGEDILEDGSSVIIEFPKINLEGTKHFSPTVKSISFNIDSKYIEGVGDVLFGISSFDRDRNIEQKEIVLNE